MREWTTRTFKSGNSVALRLPKALGFEEGEDVVLSPHKDGSIGFWRKRDTLAKLMSLYGAFSPGFMSQGRGDTDQEDYDWSRPQRHNRAA